LRRFWAQASQNYFFWIGAAIFFAFLVDFYFLGSLDNFAEGFLYGWRAWLTSFKTGDPQIIVVGIDRPSIQGEPENGIQGLGRFPWPRSAWAKLLIAAKKCHVKLVVFDLLFDHKMPGDALMAKAMAKGPPVILAEIVQPSEFGAGEIDSPIPWFEKNSAGVGFINLFSSSEFIAALPLAVEVKPGVYVPSLDLAVLRYWLGNPPLLVKQDSVVLGTHHWHTYGDDHRFFLRWSFFQNKINPEKYRVSHSTFTQELLPLFSVMSRQYISVVELLNFQNNPFFQKVLAGKILLVGAADPTLRDFATTPLGSKYGVEIHANAINDLLHNLYYRDVGFFLNFLMLFLTSACLAFILKKLSPIKKFWILLFFVVAYGILNLFLFARGFWFHLAGPWFSFVLVYSGATLHHLLDAEKKKSEISRIYGRYLAPQVRDQLLKNFDSRKSDLLGTVREVTVLESDIRGFTTLSESLSAEAVVRLLNIYFTAMIPILYKHGGTWDKFIGDALLAYFGAPTSQPDHAIRAVSCAIEMQEKVEAMRSRGEIPFQVGIGIHTGMVKVGHIGADATPVSQEQKQFTIIGDTVNLAARLCSLAEGGSIILSEATFQALNGKFQAESLGPVLVKGKTQEVKIYRISLR
jgi:class 3 adenylate cyclase/CHASE2 domain-containing sensor protein